MKKNDNVSTQNPWGPVTIGSSPLIEPKGVMFTHGSACGSLPTTSLEGHTYVSDVHFFRRDGNGVDIDQYRGSITPANTLAVLKIPSGQIPHHHLKPTDPIVSSLPVDKQKQILSILGTQQNP